MILPLRRTSETGKPTLLSGLYPLLEYPLKYFNNSIVKYTQPNFHGQFKWHKLNGNPVTETEYANHWRIKHTGAIVGGVIGSVALITAILGVFYIRRWSKKRNGALGSSLESQPPLARKPVPVILTPDPFTLKYLES
ncbi:hypothetical protein EV359DRAFT_67534 [Lentinula novae-zelandiae]|nr:hypothetical protein EV359DRAFT_67534 [Lentinula novae-zelandiae]